MAQLAIKGHPTRGKEVIQLLETLGGINSNNLKAISKSYFYYIKDAIINIEIAFTEDFKIYTLEEFEEKFPYKVGDKVTNEYRLPMIIFDIYWDSDFNVIKYNVRFLDDDKTVRTGLTAEDLQPYKEENYCQIIGNDTSSNGVDTSVSSINEETMKEPEPKAPILSNRYDYNGGKCGYVIPDGYEFDSIKEGFKTEIIIRPIKPQYPKTYEECCRIIDYHLTGETIIGYKKSLLENLQQLLISRDAYWKIAGEQMGLGKPWKPDWKNEKQKKYCIYHARNDIQRDSWYYCSVILAFPTMEMRDAFYDNFKELIQECKELL